MSVDQAPFNPLPDGGGITLDRREFRVTFSAFKLGDSGLGCPHAGCDEGLREAAFLPLFAELVKKATPVKRGFTEVLLPRPAVPVPMCDAEGLGMDPRVMAHMHRIVRDRGVRPKRALEVGGYVNEKSLLRSPEIREAERWCINLVDQPRGTGIEHVVGNANDMHMFDEDSFDLVMCNAMLEHDRRFWLSIAEMRRVTAPGGLLVIGVPGFRKRKRDQGKATATYKVHYRFDYYRFSRQAVREVFFEGMEDVKVRPILDPPRIVGHGYKPR
jgi:SAM-dependent methyltransferase